MASITLFPNADGSIGSWTNELGLTTNLYQSIDEGTDSPSDADYLEIFESPSDAIFLELQNMPTLLASVSSVVVKLRCKKEGSGSHATALSSLQIFETDELTPLTSSVSIADGTSIATLTLNPSIIGSTSKSAWDGARVKIISNAHSEEGSAFVYALQVEMEYSTSNTIYNESGSGGSLVGGSRVSQFIYSPRVASNVLLSGHAFFTNNMSVFGGVALGGSFLAVHDIKASGGGTLGSSGVIALTLNTSNKINCLGGGSCVISAIYNITSLGGSLGGGKILNVNNIISLGGGVSGGIGFISMKFTKTGSSDQGTKVACKNIEDAIFVITSSGGNTVSGTGIKSYSYNITGGIEIGGLSRTDIGIMAKGGVIGTGGDNLTVAGRGGVTIGGRATPRCTYILRSFNDYPGGLWTGTKHAFFQNLPTTGSAEATISLTHDNIFSWHISYRDLLNTPIVYLGLYRNTTWIHDLLGYSSVSNSGITGKVNILPSLLENPNIGWSIELITPTNYNNGELNVDFSMPPKSTSKIQLSTSIRGSGGCLLGGSATFTEVDFINGGLVGSGTSKTSVLLTNINSSGGVSCLGNAIFELAGIFYHDERGRGGVRLGGGVPEVSDPRDGAKLSGAAGLNVVYQTCDRIPLLGELVVPPKQEIYSGSVQFNKISNIIYWDIQYNGPESEITDILINGPAEEGEVGPLIIDLGSISGLMMPNSGSFVVPNQLLDDLDEQYYLEIYATDPVLRCQITLNGSGGTCTGVAETPTDVVIFGGVKCSGTNTVKVIRRINGIGGGRSGGVAFVSRQQNRKGSGGSTCGGTMVLNVLYSPTVTGGVRCGGTAASTIFIFASGGGLIGSSAIVLLTKTQIPTGGCLISGSVDRQDFYLSRSSFGGVTLGGKSKVYRISELTQITFNVSRALNSSNKSKDDELELLHNIVELIQVKDEDTPLSELDDLNFWCDPEVRCSEGIVPKIAQKRQPMPANKITH